MLRFVVNTSTKRYRILARANQAKIHLNCRRLFCVEEENVDQQSNDENTLSTKAIQAAFQCNEINANRICRDLSNHQVQLEDLKCLIAWLLECGSSLPVIMDNIQLIHVPLNKLKERYKYLKTGDWQKFDDMLPLLHMSMLTLKRLSDYQSKVTKSFSGRVYYFSQRMNLEPVVVSKYLAKHPSMFEMKLSLLERKIDLLLSYDVAPINIMRDLDVLSRDETVLLSGLKYIKSTVITRIMPWMLKCDNNTLERSIEIRETQGLVVNYLQKELNWSIKMTNDNLKRFPNLKNFSLKKVKSTLDALLKRVDAKQINANISVLGHSPKKIERRCNELEAIGYNFKSINFVNYNEERFKNFVEKLKLEENNKNVQS